MEFHDLPLPCRLVRSRRRSLALEVTRNLEIVVRAPLRASESSIRAFVEAHRAWLSAAADRQKARQALHPEPTEEEAAALRRRAREILPGKVAFYAKIMGVAPTAVRVTSARTRFGSCSPKNSLSFSWRLMQYPETAIDYVVVHELAHIRRRDHSKAFYAIVAEVLPDYKARQKLLKL